MFTDESGSHALMGLPAMITHSVTGGGMVVNFVIKRRF
jgi:hypothetical protein